MNQSTLSFRVCATGADLHLVVRLNETVIYNGTPDIDFYKISHDFDDLKDHEYVLTFDMSGKLPEHTVLDDQAQIIRDRVIEIKDLAFDEIALGHLFTEVAVYHHDTNGTTEPIKTKFFGTMGCNGRVEMRFSTPLYLWLLENM